jgi:DNA-binding transcriptional regulator YhcF (GntR family)
VLKGELQPGQRVPSVRELAASAKVNPNTMQRALTELERDGLLVGGGTSGRTVTTDQVILAAMRKNLLEEVARQCAAKFKVLGVSPSQAAQLLLELQSEMEE